MKVIDEVRKIRAEEGNSLDYEIRVGSDRLKRLPGVVFDKYGNMGYRSLHLRNYSKDPRLHMYEESVGLIRRELETEHKMLDDTTMKTPYRVYTILVKDIPRRISAYTEGLEVEFHLEDRRNCYVRNTKRNWIH